MSQATLSLSFLRGLFNTRAAYILCYGWLSGMSVWVTFFGGVIAHRILPRQQFSALQRRTFPVYFSISLLLSSFLLVLWVFHHPRVLAQLDSPLIADVAQVYALASVVWFQGVNQFVIGPMTGKTRLQWERLEKTDGGTHDKTVSDELKALKARFGMLHGISSLANLCAVIALIFHGLCLGAEIHL